MKEEYKINQQAIIKIGNLIDEKAQEKTGTSLYQRILARELDISNSSIRRLSQAMLSDIKLSTFIALAKYLQFSEEEIIEIYNLAISNNSECQDIKSIAKKKLNKNNNY